jgi:hypothetical protein
VWNSYSQNYGNEWIDYNQQYFKLSIPKTGLYRIDSATLFNSGIPINTINPKTIQLFIKGKEQHVFINGESDNSFNTGDYIEFYAEKNDCSFDSLAYTNIARLPNPYIALFNDTNYAFITWNNKLNNKRCSEFGDVNFSGYTATPYFYSEKIFTDVTSYSTGQKFIGGISDPRYLQSEGYGRSFSQGQTIQTNFSNLNIFSSSLPTYIKSSYSGTSDNYVAGGLDHQIEIDFLNNNNSYTNIHDTMFFGYPNVQVSKQIASNQFQNSSQFRIKSINNPIFSGINNSTILHYLSFKYPQTPNFNGASEGILYVDDSNSASNTYLDLQNINIGSGNVLIYDITNNRKITSVATSNNVKALIPNSSTQKKCFITNTSNINLINKLSPVNQTGYFVNYKSSNADSAFLIVTHKELENSALSYKAYRQSVAGGSNKVIMALVEDLYDQFTYGNTKNPLAIRNFCKYLSDSLNTPPKYLFLIGKSIKNNLVRSNSTNWKNCAVPTMGTPSSDNLFTTNIKGTNSVTPFIPVGRLSATINQQVYWYIDKVTVHEQGLKLNTPEEWRKNIIHFAGGSDLYQQQLFKTFLTNYENIINDTLFGGRVFSFNKTSTAPIQLTVSDSVKQLINNGVSLITFFGHGSVTGFDQAIDDPNQYSNKDKYPVFLANSCYSGDIHTPNNNSTSEVFTMTKDKGSIAFIASSSSGVVSPLHAYSTDFYKSISYYTYNKGIGDATKYTSERNSIFNNQLLDITSLEMTLQGDPSIKLNAYAKPDYEINNTSVFFNTTRHTDSIGINIRIKNLGKAINDSIVVRTKRFLPQGDSITFFKKIKAPQNLDTLKFFILKDFENGIGLNKFRVHIDFYNQVPELNETNNYTNGTVDLFIPGGDVMPVYPYKYAVIPHQPQVTLKASTADPFASATNYKLQLDTNDTFTNPIAQTIINSSGGIIEWNVNLPFGDSTVYFWRISKDSTVSSDNFKWRESTFQVIGNKTGWAQAHFHQFKNNKYQFVKYSKPQRKFNFANDKISITCHNEISGNFAEILYTLNNFVESNWKFAFNGWSIAVLDSISIKPWTSRVLTGSTFASPYNNCLAYPDEDRASFDFGENGYCGNTPNWKNDLLNFFNAIPNNNYVLAYSSDYHKSSTYNNALYQAFESIGSANIRTVPDSVPMIIFGKKRATPLIGSANEVIGSTKYSLIDLEDTITTKWTSGYVESELIGPSAKWNSLHWHYRTQNTLSTDTVILKVVGLSNNGFFDTLATFNYTNFDVPNLFNYVNASNYSYIKLVALLKDNTAGLAPQMRKWQVLYDEVPECAINPKKGYVISADSVQEGEKLIIQLPIENIGQLPFNDSLLVTYWLEDNNRVKHNLPSKLKPNPFVPGQLFLDTIQLNSMSYPGLNYLWIEVNPLNNSRHQIEQYHFNNIARIAFKVGSDKINPLLDVTFDGTHILNGDIVSSRPHILISLKDENKFLALNDTSNFVMFLKSPITNSEKRIFFANQLQFTPAQLPNNSCKIEYRPELLDDGKYKLIVQATDRSKNASGAIDYNIEFEIINKQTVTEVLNYPNPFSTATRFVFTLTGSEIPDVFTIQIMTITGKVVREITKAELGNIRIGRNISDYVWDGKDDYGDKLANGVYLYRVITRHNGKAIEKRETEADSFFKKGFGKLVIMR